MQYAIIEAYKDELEQISQLGKDLFGGMIYPSFVLRQFYNIMPEMMLVALRGRGEIIGYTVGGLQTEEKKGWILSLGTKSNLRGLGIGYALADRFINELRSKGVDDIYLTVHPKNKPVIQLLIKLDLNYLNVLMITTMIIIRGWS